MLLINYCLNFLINFNLISFLQLNWSQLLRCFFYHHWHFVWLTRSLVWKRRGQIFLQSGLFWRILCTRNANNHIIIDVSTDVSELDFWDFAWKFISWHRLLILDNDLIQSILKIFSFFIFIIYRFHFLHVVFQVLNFLLQLSLVIKVVINFMRFHQFMTWLVFHFWNLNAILIIRRI